MNIRSYACALSMTAIVGWGASANAATVIGSLNITNYSGTAGHQRLAQTFQVPAGETGINSASIVMHNESVATSGQFHVYTYDSGTKALSSIYSVGFALPLATPQTLNFTPNVLVTVGTTYAIGIDFGTPTNAGGYMNTSSYYPDGFLLLQSAGDPPVEFPSYDLAFQVGFGSIPEPASLSILSLASLGLLARRRRLACS